MFNFVTEEHRLIADSARKLFEDLAAADTQQRQLGGGRIDILTVGRALSELGLFGSDAEDAPMRSAQVQVLVAREAGAASLPFPVLETLANHALALRSSGLSGAVAGASTTLSSVDRGLADLPVLENGRLNGTAQLVPFLEATSAVMIAAQRRGNVVLVQMLPGSSGFAREARATVEADYPLHDLRFEGATVSLMAEHLDDGSNAAAFLQQRTSLLAAAEIAGACRRMVGMTRDYLLTRSQFGQLLGSNQALKHAIADSHVRVEAMSTAVDYAAAAADAGSADAEAAVCAAKHFASRAGKAVADSMMQLHGAIGYTMEFPLHLLMRRVHRLSVSYGSSHIQGERLFKIFQESS